MSFTKITKEVNGCLKIIGSESDLIRNIREVRDYFKTREDASLIYYNLKRGKYNLPLK